MPALTFEDFDALTAEAPRSVNPSQTGSRALTFEDFDALTAEAPAKPGLDASGRVGGSIFSGLVSGVTGLAGLPADVLNMGQSALDYAQSIGQGRPYPDVSAENEKSAPISKETLERYGGAGIKQRVMSNLPEGLNFKPEGAVERGIETVSSMAAGGAPFGALRSGRAVASQVAAPAGGAILAGGAASVGGLDPTSTALLEGAGAMAGGVGGAFAASRTTPANVLMRDRVRNMNPDDLMGAQAIIDEGAARGVRITADEALAQYTGQTNNPLTSMRTVVERTPEGAEVFGPIMAERPGQVQAAAEGVLREVSPTLPAPGELGETVRREARGAFNNTAPAREMLEATRAAGPRISPEQAGRVIQPELRGVYDRRFQAREDAAAPLYREADRAPERIGVDRTLEVERPGEPVVTYPQGRPQFTDEAPRPLEDFVRGKAEAAGGQPESLARFVARNGGIALDGDARAADFQKYNIPGLGNVARPDGRSIDQFWREELIAKGYLREDPDGGAARDITNELLRKLQNEQRGVPSYPIGNERGATRQTVTREADEYQAALSTAESRLDADLEAAGIPPASLHPDIRERALGALVRGETYDGAEAYESVVRGMRDPPAPYVRSSTVREEIDAPRFGQVNPRGTLDYIDRELATAKGEIKAALEKARAHLFEPQTGQVDLSVAGLRAGREAMKADIEAGSPSVQRALMNVRDRLDADLSVAPEYERARSTYENLSRPLDPFDPQRPLGRVVGQDPRTRQFELPPEQVPAALNSPSALREFREAATPAARRAQERAVTTRFLDDASDGRGDVNAERLLVSIRDNQDLLANLPEVRQRLMSVATAREGLARAEGSTLLGRLSRDPDVNAARQALFAADPNPQTHAEIERTMRALVNRNPRAASELLRFHLEASLNTARKSAMAGEGPKTGAKFAVALKGQPQQWENLQAVLRAFPDGAERIRGFERFFDVLEATGKAPGNQSITAFAQQEMKNASQGNLLQRTALAGKTAGLSLKRQFEEFYERVNLGRNMGQVANLLTRADSGRLLAELARMPPGASRAQILALRLTYMGRQGAADRQEERAQ